MTGGPGRALAVVLIRSPWPVLPVNFVQDCGERELCPRLAGAGKRLLGQMHGCPLSGPLASVSRFSCLCLEGSFLLG